MSFKKKKKSESVLLLFAITKNNTWKMGRKNKKQNLASNPKQNLFNF